ncbi:MAG: NADP-dependent malic enzyme [Candidatus Gracilibacteria bacterium]|nr:NADP-dependent malic enzyme [Candidatus Gracilibacteria bacterium]
MDYQAESLKIHEQHKGKLEIKSKVEVRNIEELSVAYTPGVAEPCRKIAENSEDAYKYTIKANTIAVVTDGSAVLGLGNIGALAGLPVMEGKCLLFKQFANVDAYPICLATQDTEEIIQTIKNIAPTFGGINLEDISAPRCFEIERRLKEELPIPVFHDDQHGTAIVVLAGLINALKITGRSKEDLKVLINGAGAAGVAICKILLNFGVPGSNIVVLDSKGTIHKKRENLNFAKTELAELTNSEGLDTDLEGAIAARNMFIGLSKPGLLSQKMVKSMASDPIIFAMANPVPEIMPEEAQAAGCRVIATGRSDYPNQLNNVLAFPGIMRGALDARTQISEEMKLRAAEALASMVKTPTPEKFIPNPFDKGVAEAVAEAIMNSKFGMGESGESVNKGASLVLQMCLTWHIISATFFSYL